MRNFVFVLLICFVLAGAVLAASEKGEKGGKDSDKENEAAQVENDSGESETVGAEPISAKTNDNGNDNGQRERLKATYEEARQNYAESMNKWKEGLQESRDIRIQKGKDYTVNAVSLLKGMLKVADEQVMNANKLTGQEKEKYQERLSEREHELEGIANELNNASTAKEVIEQAKRVRDEWQESKHAARDAIGGIGVGRINDAIDLGWKAENRTEELVSKCAQAGFDVSQANADLEQFREQLRLAEQENELAGQAFENDTGSSTSGYAHLQEAHKHMVEAKKLAQNLKEDLKQCVLKRGHVAFAGNGWLAAKGTGRAEITGNGTVEANFTGNASSGKVTIMDRAGDAVISVLGGNETKSNETEKEFEYIKVKMYVGAGSVKVSGSRFTVVLNGNDMELYAQGNGIAILRGTGTYEAGSAGNSTIAQNGTWTGKGAAVRIAEAEGGDE